MTRPPQIFIETPLGEVGTTFALPSEEAHHLRDVLRRRKGEEIIVIHSASQRRCCTVIEELGPPVILRITKTEALEPNAPFRVHSLCLALCKGDRNDLVCEK